MPRRIKITGLLTASLLLFAFAGNCETDTPYFQYRVTEGGQVSFQWNSCLEIETVMVGGHEYERCELTSERVSELGFAMWLDVSPGYRFDGYECEECPDDFDAESTTYETSMLSRNVSVVPILREELVQLTVKIDYDDFSRHLGSARILVYDENNRVLVDGECENRNDGSNDDCEDYDVATIELTPGDRIRVEAMTTGCFDFEGWAGNNLIVDGTEGFFIEQPDYTLTFMPDENDEVELIAEFDAKGGRLIPREGQTLPNKDCS